MLLVEPLKTPPEVLPKLRQAAAALAEDPDWRDDLIDPPEVLGVEVGPVLLARESGVTVGRHDQVAVGHGSPFGPGGVLCHSGIP